jgi:protoporphyrinogen oxidase
MPCAEISADWAAQRIKNLSLGRAVRAALLGDQGQQVTSLVEQFLYPRLGPGQMFEGLARRVVQRGGELRLRCRALGVEVEGSAVRALRYADEAGQVQRVACSALFSSIPLTSLVLGLDPAPPTEVQAAARALRFRHMISVNLMVEGEGLFPDNWVYVHSPELKVGRIQNYGNWSPHMVPGPGWSGLGLEYFSQDGDALWEMSDSQLLELARRELGATGLCRARVVGGRVVRAPRAYPVYHRGYEGLLGRIIDHVRPIAGLYPMGRYGMFKYNNSDHSIHTGLLSVQNHLGAQHDIWSINADEGYHEERPGRPGVG